MENKYRNIAVGFLLLMIVAMSIVIFINKDTWFRNEAEIKYSDGCVESYLNTELVTPICEEGRRLEEERNNGGLYQEWNPIVPVN